MPVLDPGGVFKDYNLHKVATLFTGIEEMDALGRYREVTGSNPVEVLAFSGFYTQLLKLRS